MEKNIFSRKGQTLIEAMVGIGILTVGLLGIMGLLARSFLLSRIIADDLKATYLASEGVELAKNINDHDVYAHLASPPTGAGWGSSWDNLTPGQSKSFEIDYSTCNNDPAICTPTPFVGNGTPLTYDPATHLYGYGGSVQTPFTREIRVSIPNANPNEIVVQSIVRWSTGPVTSESIDIEDHFFNWHA